MKPEGHCTVIVNPTSGHERAPRYIPLLHSVLSKRFDDIIIWLTEKPLDATNFAREAAEQGRDVICMGGDGTINEVINGMVPVDSESTFGFVPFGTVNDLARALHIPRSPQGAIRMLETAVKTNIDVGKVNDRYFINVVGAGSISEAVGKVTIKEKTLFGSLAYYMKGMQVVSKQKSYHSVLKKITVPSSKCPLPSLLPCSRTPPEVSTTSFRRKSGIRGSSSSACSMTSNGSWH